MSETQKTDRAAALERSLRASKTTCEAGVRGRHELQCTKQATSFRRVGKRQIAVCAAHASAVHVVSVRKSSIG